MAEAKSLIPGLENIVRDGDPKRRGEAVRKISELFLRGASRFQPAHVDLFDGVLTVWFHKPRSKHAQSWPNGCPISSTHRRNWWPCSSAMTRS